jgi:hypothetical protein
MATRDFWEEGVRFYKRFPWNAKYETVYRWLASFIVIYTIMNLKSEAVLKIYHSP